MPQGETQEQVAGPSTMGQPFTRFIGVDLGGGKGKKTALAVLERSRGGVTVTQLAPRPKQAPLYDGALVSTLVGLAAGAVVCVDAPLTLPPCLRCTVPICPGQAACVDGEVVSMRGLLPDRPKEGRDLRRGKPAITPYTQRATELYLHRRGIAARESMGQAMGPLTARAAHLVRALAGSYRLNHNLIEVYPRATLELIGFREPYKKRVDRRIEILAALGDLSFGPGVWREECRQSDHAFDAVLCAYTGYLRQRDGWQISPLAGEAVDPQGWIWVPPEATGGASPRPLPPADPARRPAGAAPRKSCP
jgi:predicted nuclease with RNAse H fold